MALSMETMYKRLKGIPTLKEKVARLWRQYNLTTDVERRSRIERAFSRLYWSHLDKDFSEENVLLPPPPEETVAGDVPIGFVNYQGQDKHPFCLSKNALLQHTMITGRSGAGKTTLVFNMLRGLQRLGSAKYWLLDWKRDYRPLLKDQELGQDVIVFTVGRRYFNFPFNPLQPPPGSEDEILAYFERLLDTIAANYLGGAGVKSILRTTFKSLLRKHKQDSGIALTLRNLLAEIQDFDPSRLAGRYARRGHEWKVSSIRILEELCYGEYGKALNVHQSLNMESLLSHNVIFELDALNEAQRVFFCESMLLWLRTYFLGKLDQEEKETLKLVLVIEEAHQILKTGKEMRSSSSVLESTLRMTRSLGMGLIIVDQCPSLIDKVVFANTFTTICLSLKGNANIRAAANALLLKKEEVQFLGRLEVGVAIAKLSDGWFDPFLVHIPDSPIKRVLIRDSEVVEHNLASLSADTILNMTALERTQNTQPSPEDRSIYEKSLLLDILKHPFSGITSRYERLAISRRKGNNAKQNLLKEKLIEVREIEIPRGKIVCLVLTTQGRNILRESGHDVSSYQVPPTDKFRHYYWQDTIAVQLRAVGWTIQKEAHITDDGFIDLLAEKDGRAVAVEIELGKSAISNIKKCIKAGYRHVVSVVFLPGERENARLEVKDIDLAGGEVAVIGPEDVEEYFKRRSSGKGQAD